VNRSDDFVIREYCVDVRHPCLTQILDFCRDQSIAEAALQAACLDHANRLRTAPYLSSIMHTRIHNCVASLLTKILISHLHFCAGTNLLFRIQSNSVRLHSFDASQPHQQPISPANFAPETS
jgi:hypothetical protein